MNVLYTQTRTHALHICRSPLGVRTNARRLARTHARMHARLHARMHACTHMDTLMSQYHYDIVIYFRVKLSFGRVLTGYQRFSHGRGIVRLVRLISRGKLKVINVSDQTRFFNLLQTRNVPIGLLFISWMRGARYCCEESCLWAVGKIDK